MRSHPECLPTRHWFAALGNQGVETIVGILLINWIVRGHVTGKGSELLNLR